ncbi:hypothetical protein SLS62_002135 [Diatrype stigma]|uniref:Uncharacterized protein n=1 Tax=Diatrype stigma TaxID=117547 RepID=A0AAN9V796_9PEZI
MSSRPACLQCRRAKWPCDFASNTPGTGTAGAEAACAEDTRLLIGLRASPTAVPHENLGDLDLQLLSYFRLVTGKEFALFFDDPVWEGRVLQVSHAEPTIHHASLAISALSLDQNSAGEFWGRGGSRRVCSAAEYATKQYSLAIQRLNFCMENQSVPECAEVLMLGILMFIHLEFMRGYQDMVLVHLRGAFALLEKLKTFMYNTDYLDAALAFIKAQMWELSHFGDLRQG